MTWINKKVDKLSGNEQNRCPLEVYFYLILAYQHFFIPLQNANTMA
jgi:hypothetical protein